MNRTAIYFLIILAVTPSVALAQGFDPVTPFQGTSTGSLISSIRTIVNALLGLAALAAAIMLIIGIAAAAGAGDNEEASAQAKNNIIYVVLGLIVIALSALIVNFIITAAT